HPDRHPPALPAPPLPTRRSSDLNGASVNAGVGITASGVTVLSATRLTATFTIAAAASAGARDVTVTNPSGTGGTLANAFTIMTPDRKSTRLNSSHLGISYAVFCL